MEITSIKSNTFLNDWLAQIHTKVSFIPDKALADALHYLETNGIPNLKTEAYRNIPIESILKRYFNKITISSENYSSVKQPDYPNTIFLHPQQTQYFLKEKGIAVYSPNNLPDSLKHLIGNSNLHQNDFFAALNTAYCPSINVIHITQSLQHPLYIIHTLTSSNFNQNRILLVIDEKVRCTIAEEYSASSQQPVLYNFTGEIFINENAQVHWINVQNNPNFYLYTINNYSFSLAKSTQFQHHQITLNGSLWRNNLNIHINNKNASANLFGLSIGKQHSIISQNTAIFHHSPDAHSNQLYKNIADDKSIVLFNGFIRVDKNAQKTNAYQSSKNLLLNDNATLYAKPQLEIYADDVKCSHGSSTGALNEDALFYLRARGIDKPSAQKLLLYAFFNDIIESIENNEIKQSVLQQIEI